MIKGKIKYHQYAPNHILVRYAMPNPQLVFHTIVWSEETIQYMIAIVKTNINRIYS